MSLTSFYFFIFLIVALVLYYIFPKYQKCILLISSLLFYKTISSHKIWLLLTIIFSVTFFGAILIDKFKSIYAKRFTLIISIGVLFFILFFYRYAHNFIALILEILNVDSNVSCIRLIPYIGISYFSLSAIGYLVDIYWNSYKPEKNPIYIANFIFFFPQVISGPITRFSEMREQFINEQKFNYQNIEYGLRRMLWGYFKKFVISERFAMISTGVYSHYTDFGAIDIVLATLCYAIQLYTDFSGCMDIIMGAGRLFGIKLPENFKAPFFSKTIQEFWQRWHITLGLWFKDYVMFPVQMNPAILKLGKICKEKCGKNIGKKVPFYISMSVLWFLIGIWHGGTGYYFIASAIIPFVLLTLSDLLKPVFENARNVLGNIVESFAYRVFQSVRTVLLICICWLFVCSNSTKNSFIVIKHCFYSITICNFNNNFNMFYLGKISILIMILGCLILFFADYLQNKNSSIFAYVDKKPVLFKYCVLYAEILTIMIFGKIGVSQFIYFQF